MKSLAVIWLSFLSLILNAQNPYDVQPKTETHKESEQIQTKEEKFVSENFPFIHMADWKPGMRFMVEPDKYADQGSRSELKLSRYKKSGSNATGPLQKDYQGKIFTVVNLEERKVSCPIGRCTRTYVILECEGTKFEYEFIGSLEEMRQSESFASIDKLIYLDEIDKARELLINKNLYLLKDPLSTHQTQLIPVTITNIGIGTTILSGPIKIIYTTESGKEYSIEVKLSGTNVYSKAGRTFQDIFAYENPRNSYPDISDEIWGLIQNGKLKIGMTEKECELSWGKPEKINVTVSDSGRQQQWVYSTCYLYFESGRLTTIQN